MLPAQPSMHLQESALAGLDIYMYCMYVSCALPDMRIFNSNLNTICTIYIPAENPPFQFAKFHIWPIHYEKLAKTNYIQAKNALNWANCSHFSSCVIMKLCAEDLWHAQHKN